MPRGVYLLCRGRAKLSMVSSEGKTIILRIAEAGEVLGLSACMLSQPYQATVETLNPCQLNFIRREDFLRFIRGNPEALFRAAEFLSREYSSACHEISSLGLSHSAAEKTARLLLQFHRVASAGNGNGALLKLTVTHEEMAQMIGASRETVTRMLARFRVRGYIEIRGANLRICDHAALQALAENHRPPPASLPATASGAGRLPQKPAGDSTVSRSGSPRRQIALVAAD
jgi:CRP/FNR family transcriptional regulator